MFKEERFISREDIIKERTTSDFCHWVENNLKEWSSKRKTHPDGEELNNRIILGKGLFKYFHQEVLPFCRYLQVTKQQTDSLECRLFLDSKLNYDAELRYGSSIQRYEITIAQENRHDIRMEKFLEVGRVSLSGSMKYAGTRRTGRKIVDDDALYDRTTVIKNKTSQVLKAFDRKTKDRTKNQDYDQNTILLIAIDDCIINAEDQPDLDNTLRHYMIASQTIFKSVNIIGISGKILLEYLRNV